MCMCCTGIGSGARVQELEKVPSGVFFGRPGYTTSPDVGTEKEECQKGFLTTAVHYYRCSYHKTSDSRERQGGCWAMILGDVTICLYQRKCPAMPTCFYTLKRHTDSANGICSGKKSFKLNGLLAE